MSWTSWSARLSSLALNLPKVLANQTNQSATCFKVALASSADMTQTVRTATLRFKMNMYVTKQLTLTATVEDNYNNLTQTDRHAWFGDVQAKYKLGKADLELEVNNIFNQKTYTRVNYSGLDIHASSSRLRPMSVIAKLRFKLL